MQPGDRRDERDRDSSRGNRLRGAARAGRLFQAREQKASRRVQLLGEIARVADGGRSLEETLEAITAIVVPELGDFCMIDVKIARRSGASRRLR